MVKPNKVLDDISASLSYVTSPAIWDHTVLPATGHRCLNPSQYSIYLPRKDGRLS